MKVAMPWWQSKVIIGGGLSLLATLLKATGVIGDVGDETLTQITDAVLTLIAAGGALTAVGARVAQKEAPVITGSNAGADLIKAAAVAAAPRVLEAVDEDGTIRAQLGDLSSTAGVEVPSWMLR